MNFYEAYKPFRNYMRRFDLVPGLIDLWHYSVNLMENQPLPPDYAVGKGAFVSLKQQHIYPWDLDILAKELVLNAGKRGDRSLKMWDHLAVAVNHIRQLDGTAYMWRADPSDVIFELHRIAHRQFPWQISVGMAPMMRVFKVFGETAVEAIVIRELGMTVRQFLLLGTAVGGHFQTDWGMSTNQDYGELGISRDASDAFFRRITCTTEQLKTETAKRQSYGRDWLYMWNPLEATPLVGFDPAFPDRVLCPIPRYLLRRASAGIFYDLVNSAGFTNPFGDAFQAYVAEVIEATCPPPRFTALAEEPYYSAGKGKMHGVDWVLSDSTAHLFIECKAKRLTLKAKTLSDAEALDSDLDVLARAVVQHYRNIGDALGGKTKWAPDGLPIYPMVLTLEDWFIFSPRVAEMLKKHVCRLLAEANISEEVLMEMPYTIASAHEFEITSQVIAQVGIFSVMTKQTSPERQGWSLLPLARNDFPEEMRRVNWRLFADDWARMMPDIPA